MRIFWRVEVDVFYFYGYVFMHTGSRIASTEDTMSHKHVFCYEKQDIGT